MAYMDKEIKAVIAKNLKPVLNRHGLKGTLSTTRHSIKLILRSGKVDFLGRNPSRYISINEYHYKKHFPKNVVAVLDDIMEALKSGDWYDKSDIMTDYFNTAYYIYIEVGTPERPYELDFSDLCFEK